MPLTPLDIHNKEFKKGFRGYDEAEVDEFLDEVVRDYEALLRENAVLKDELAKRDGELEHYRGLEEALKRSVLVAERAAEDVRAAAQRQAEAVVQEAQARAAEIVAEAEERARQAGAEIDRMRVEARKFRLRMRSLLLAQLELYGDDFDAEAEGAAAAGEAPEAPGDD